MNDLERLRELAFKGWWARLATGQLKNRRYETFAVLEIAEEAFIAGEEFARSQLALGVAEKGLPKIDPEAFVRHALGRPHKVGELALVYQAFIAGVLAAQKGSTR